MDDHPKRFVFNEKFYEKFQSLKKLVKDVYEEGEISEDDPRLDLAAKIGILFIDIPNQYVQKALSAKGAHDIEEIEIKVSNEIDVIEANKLMCLEILESCRKVKLALRESQLTK